MTEQALASINSILNAILPYEFLQWTDTLVFPFWVGEYSEVGSMSENGEEESTFILTGTTKGKFLDLESGKQTIAQEFPKISGRTVALSDGYMKVWYETAFPIPTDNNDIKRLQVNLRVKEWKVNNL